MTNQLEKRLDWNKSLSDAIVSSRRNCRRRRRRMLNEILDWYTNTQTAVNEREM